MTTTHALRQSTHQFLPFGIDFSIKDDHLGVRNTHILEELIDGKLDQECNMIAKSLVSLK